MRGMTFVTPPPPPVPPPSPLDNPLGVNPPVRPTSYPDTGTALPPLPPVPAAPAPVSSSNVQGEASTITVTATATIPQPAVPEVRGPVLPDGNYVATAGDPPVNAHGWALVRFYVWKFGGTLLMERAHEGEYVMSRSALPFFALLLLAAWKWAFGLEIPAGLEKMMYALLGVMFGDRGLAIVQQLVTAKHGDPYAGRER